MATYTAATAAVNIVPRIDKSFQERVKAATSGINATVKVTPDFGKFVAPNMRPIPVQVQPNIDNAALARIEQALRALPKIELDADSTAAQQKVAEIRARLETLRNKVINVQVSDQQARSEMALLQRELDSIDRMNPSIDVQVDTAAASAALQRVDAEVARVSGKSAHVTVDVDTGAAIGRLASVQAALSVIGASSASPRIDVDATGALASIAKVAAAIAALGGLAGVVGGLAGALGGIGAAGAVAGSGLGVALLGFMGVGKAVGALNTQQEQAGATAKQAAQQQAQAAQQVQSAQISLQRASEKAGQARSDAARNVTRAESESASQIASAQQSLTRASTAAGKARVDAAKSVAAAEQQAERAVSSAREQAGRAVASALQQQEAAQQRAARATRDLRQAQSELTSAWEVGRRSLQDLQDQLDMSLIDQRQAALDLKDARKALDEARASGDTDAIARAQIAYDRQVETIDQLAKRTQRLGTDNQAAQQKGVAGTQEYRSALDKVSSAQEAQSDALKASGDAAKAVNQARADGARSIAQAEQDGAARIAAAREQGAEQIAAADQRVADAQAALSDAQQKGAQRVADAREQGARQIQAADQAVMDAQRALQQALAQTGTAGQSAADKVAQAFANLSPAAAAFAKYLYGLKPVLDQLSATAAAGLFPPLQEGIDTLLARLPLINTVVGQLAAGMGAGLKLVLTELANPFWAGFFTTLGNAAGTVIPGMFAALMSLARAAASLIQALLPLAPAGFAIIEALSGLITYLAPFLAQLLGSLIPTAGLFIQALYPLGPLLAALGPILAALGGLLSQVLGALLTALTPILQALTPLFQQLAASIGTWLVGAIQAVTPFLVAVATWMSQNPGLVLAMAGAIAGLALAFQGLMWIGGVVAALAPLMTMFTTLSPIVTRLLGPLGGVSGILGTLGGAVRFLLGPWGLLIGALITAFTTCQPFRDAIMGLLGVFGQLIGQLVTAVMPIFQALAGVLQMLAGVFGMIVTQLAMALVPVINLVAGVLTQLVSAILPPLMGIINALVPVITLLAGVFAQVLMAVVGPVIGALTQLISAILPPLVGILQSVVIPVVQMLAGIFSGVLAFVITNVLIPAIQFLVPIITWLANLLATVLTWAITNVVVPALGLLVPMFQFIGTAAQWLWTNVLLPVWSAIQVAWNALLTAMQWAWDNILKPVFDFIGVAARVLFAIVFTVLIAPLLAAWNMLLVALDWAWQNILLPCWQAIQAAANWLWVNVLQPIFAAIGVAWQALMDGLNWVWINILKPCWDAIIAALNWLYLNVWLPIMTYLGNEWNKLMALIDWVWLNILKPVWDAIIAALNWLYLNVWLPIMDYLGREWQKLMDLINWVWLNILKPCFDAVAAGLGWLRDRFNDAVNWVGDIWNRLRGLLAKPINFMIDTVWNKGVVPAWNAVAGLVGLGPIKELGKIPEARTGGRVDSRGMIHGPGTGTSDSILGRVKENDAPIKVSNREFIMNERATKANLPALTAMNGGATIGDGGNERRARKIPAFAGGGPVWQGLWDTVRGRFPNARLTDAYRPGANDYHGRGMAIDIAGSYPMAVSQMKEINQWIGTTFPGSTELIHYPLTGGGINLKNGGPHQYSPATVLGHSNHVHWAQDPANPQGGGNGGIGGIISTYFMDAARDAFDKFTNPAIDAMRKFAGDPPPEWRRAVPGLATKARDTVRDFVFGKASEKDAAASAGGGAGMMGPVGDGEKFVIGQIADSARAHRVGFDGGAIGVATGIVESGLRNLNYGDRDSVGVFQQRGNGAWGSLEQRMNVRHAADMFYNKLVSFNWRAMDPGAAAQKVQVSAFPARYGQAMPRARELLALHGGPFDSGGLAIGKGLMLKDIIQPERVLNPTQTRDYDTLSRAVRLVDVGGRAAAAVGDGQAFPSEFRISSGRLDVDGDGFVSLIDGRLEAVNTQLRYRRRA